MAVAGSYHYTNQQFRGVKNLLIGYVGSSALIVFFQLYQKKVHSHAKKHVQMFFYIFTYNEIFDKTLQQSTS